jgi:hypothetical protein
MRPLEPDPVIEAYKEHVDRLIADSIDVDAYGVTCRYLGLDKLIEVKRAAGRPKDFEAIAELETLREERDRSWKPRPGRDGIAWRTGG